MTKLDREYLKLYAALIRHPDSIGRTLRARLLALLQRHNVGLTALATAMGKGKPTYSRKLYTEHSARRPLMLTDVDEILEHLGEDAEALLRPVLWPGDSSLLKQLNDGGVVAADLIPYDGGGATTEMRIARLRAQSLVRIYADTDHYYLTKRGHRALRR